MDNDGKPARIRNFYRNNIDLRHKCNAWFFFSVLSTKGASTSRDTVLVELFTRKKKEIVFTLFTKSIYKAASDGTVSDAS